MVDVGPSLMSSIYFFHDPLWRDQALGVYSALREIQYAQENNIRYLHLGYWIEGCPSLEYKSRYRPHEILQDYPEDDQEPVWLPVENG